MKKNVLILDAESVQTLVVARFLSKNGYDVSVVANAKDTYGYHTHFAKERFIGPNAHEEQTYMEFLLSLLKSKNYDVVIPMDDDVAVLCSKFKSQICQYSNVLMPDYEVFLDAYDKNRLMKICGIHNYPHPLTIDMSDITDLQCDELKRFPYPALLKPNITSGGRGMTLVSSLEELLAVYPVISEQYGDCHLQQFIRSGGKQIKVQIMTDAEGLPMYSSVIWKQRYYPVNGGSSSCNITIENLEIAKICGEVLKTIGWTGFADFDLIENPDTGELLIMEINPRLPACVRSAFESGLDYATMIADMTLGKPLQSYTYSPGKTLRHLGFEVLWLLKSKDRWTTRPNWFKFIGKNIYYQDLSWYDFVPFICGTFGNIKKQLNPEFRKAKSGTN